MFVAMMIMSYYYYYVFFLQTLQNKREYTLDHFKMHNFD